MGWLDRFHLSTTQRKGYLVLLFLFMLFLIVRIGIIFWPNHTTEFHSTLPDEFEDWEAQQRIALTVPHTFDPNTVSDTFIYNSKISRFAATNWIKYRTKGRRFETPRDLLAIYGMDTVWFEVNKDSILISSNVIESPTQKFFFDPNTASINELQELGLPNYLAERIAKYRDAGGTFSSPKDLLKIYDFPKEIYQELKPYIRIAKRVNKKPDTVSVKKVEPVFVEINTADSLDLLTVKGIGPVYAHRIIEYRDKLGGYISKVQLLEVYGIDEEILDGINDQLVVNNSSVVKLNVNTATFKELLHHPYLNFEQVKSLVRYREQIGPFQTIEGIGQLEHFTVENAKRLTPYLTVE